MCNAWYFSSFHDHISSTVKGKAAPQSKVANLSEMGGSGYLDHCDPKMRVSLECILCLKSLLLECSGEGFSSALCVRLHIFEGFSKICLSEHGLNMGIR